MTVYTVKSVQWTTETENYKSLYSIPVNSSIKDPKKLYDVNNPRKLKSSSPSPIS